jgi:hypothetical protein
MQRSLSRVPRTATRHRNGGLEEVPLDDIAPGDRLLIRQGDVVPVDGTVASETAFVDTSALTGESLPVRLAQGAEAMSGSTNAGEAFDLTATREAAGQHLCRDRPAGRGGAGLQGADVAAGRPLVAGLSGGDSRHRLRGVVVHRRSDPRGRRARRRHALSADPCRAGGPRRRSVARGAFRGAHQGRGAARDDGAHPHADPRQDRHADRRPAADRVDRHTWRHVRRRCPVFRCGTRSGIKTPDRPGDRRGGTCAWCHLAGSSKRF